MRGKTQQPNLQFVDLETGYYRSNIWHDLEGGYWREAKPENHEHNVLCGMLDRPNWLPMLPRYYPITEGLKWNQGLKSVEDSSISPRIFPVDMGVFLDAAISFFEKFRGKHIGVQLSGGVDSSLIIGVLKHLDIPYSLVGLYNNRYEFRTEFYIQKKIMDNARGAILIDYEEHLPMSDLDLIPPHQTPDLYSIVFAPNLAVAKACVKLGIDVIITGSGGDVLFATEAPLNECKWRTGFFHDKWSQDIIYSPYGIEVEPFYADSSIAECIWNMRRGQPSDFRKLWARQKFRDFLPHELVDYTFKGDFWGLYIDGLMNNLSHMRKIHDEAFELSKNNYFHSLNLDALLSQDLHNCDQRLYQRIEARISSAIWYVSLLS